jgi:ActR/RegA family two-component response regulator
MQGETRPLALIVEDEILLTLLVEDLLAAEGFDTITATNEADAIASAAAAVQLTVAVVDLRLGGDLAGQRIIRTLRQQTPDLPVVVMTGFSGSAPEADLRGLGWPTIRLAKPGGYLELATAVWDVIDQARSGRRPQTGRRGTEQPNPP